MKIVVCLKQVPDMESKFKIIDDKQVDESQIAFKINDFDNYAVEAALQLKEKNGGEVIIVTAGPDRATKDIRQAFAMGADRGVHIKDDALDTADNYVIAKALQKAIEEIGDVDLVLTGVQAEDDQSGSTGVLLAQMLGVPHCTNTVNIDLQDKALTVNRELEGGLNEVLEMNLPALLSIQSGINDPRYPTLPGIMKAKKKQLDAKSFGDLLVTETALSEFVKMYIPKSDSMAQMIEGDAAAASKTLVDKLKNEAKVL